MGKSEGQMEQYTSVFPTYIYQHQHQRIDEKSQKSTCFTLEAHYKIFDTYKIFLDIQCILPGLKLFKFLFAQHFFKLFLKTAQLRMFAHWEIGSRNKEILVLHSLTIEILYLRLKKAQLDGLRNVHKISKRIFLNRISSECGAVTKR